MSSKRITEIGLKPGRRGARLVLAARITILCALPSGLFLSLPPLGAQPEGGPEAGGRIAELEAEVASLRAQLRSARAAPERARTAGELEPFSTAALAAAGEKARSGGSGGSGSEAFIARVIAAVNDRDGRKLYDEISKKLQAGPAGFVALHDLLRRLDESRPLALTFSIDHRNTFGLMHLGMLHTDEVASFAHYYLVATSDDLEAVMRGKLYEFIPLILEFYPGRYPELEAALKADIDRLLALPQPDYRVLDSAMASLKHEPPVGTMRKLLGGATTYNQVSALCGHLARRNDAESTRVLAAFIRARHGAKSQHVRVALNSLATMNHIEAYNALQRFLSEPRFSTPAVQAYFNVERDPGDAEVVQVAVSYLNSGAATNDKRRLVRFLRHRNPAVLDALRQDLEAIRSHQVRGLLAPRRGAERGSQP